MSGIIYGVVGMSIVFGLIVTTCVVMKGLECVCYMIISGIRKIVDVLKSNKGVRI